MKEGKKGQACGGIFYVNVYDVFVYYYVLCKTCNLTGFIQVYSSMVGALGVAPYDKSTWAVVVVQKHPLERQEIATNVRSLYSRYFIFQIVRRIKWSPELKNGKHFFEALKQHFRFYSLTAQVNCTTSAP